ncbi:MAG: lipocalin-like domain-containing protein [Desulfomonilaceae bacterium]|jgi:predicted secreted hydrolase
MRFLYKWFVSLTLQSLVFTGLVQFAYCSSFEKAVPGIVLQFPKDHGKHPGFQTEWWYFTGNLVSKNNHWGTQLTFFRRTLFNKMGKERSAWEVRDLYPAHLAITDIGADKFFHTELMSREGPGLAGAAGDRLDVHVKDWRASQQDRDILLNAAQGDYSIKLTLTPEKPVVLHGDSGLSVKGNDPDQASYYYSFTRLRAKGILTFEGRKHEVQGLMWMDHEFGSSILNTGQVGWDWFSLQLDNGVDLMAFHLRKKDGSFEKPFATFVDNSGLPTHLSGDSIQIRSSGSWVSPRSKARYPSEWVIEIPDKKLSLRIAPAVKDQELTANKSTGTSYWEGAVKITGTMDGHVVHGSGYVELTGYVESMGGRL